MTYNILEGGNDERLPMIYDIVRAENPDFLGIQEAEHFDDENIKAMVRLSRDNDLEYYALAPGTPSKTKKKKLHVASFSKTPFENPQNESPIKPYKGFANAGLETVVKTDLGLISIANIHLSPWSEEDRIRELQQVMHSQRDYENRIILGDLNSLSPYDNYDKDTVAKMNDKQRAKFTRDESLVFDVIKFAESQGYIDSRTYTSEPLWTVPTKLGEDEAHIKIHKKLDYILVAGPLAERITDVRVVKNDATDVASDHYPLVVEIE